MVCCVGLCVVMFECFGMLCVLLISYVFLMVVVFVCCCRVVCRAAS